MTVDAKGGPSLRGLFTTATGLVAVSLLAVELVAGTQATVAATILPLMARDLRAQGSYGIVTGAGQVAMFLTMPVGTWLLQRISAGRLLTWLTALTFAGAVCSALASSIDAFVIGRILTGLASGALATVSMGAIATHLPREWRRFVLAGYAAMWVVISLVGPIYASGVSAALGWRWALVLSLPLLGAARLLVARALPREAPDDERSPLDLISALLLAAGVAALAAIGGAGAWWPLPLVAGIVLVTVSAARLLPPGALRARPGRPAAVALLGAVCGIYFGASSLVTIVAHDLLGFSVTGIGILLAAGGLGWAVTGVVCGRIPVAGSSGFRCRSLAGAGLLFAGLAAMAVASGVSAGRPGTLLVAGWGLAGVGMGCLYLDTLARIIDPPERPDGIAQTEAASATVLVETIATAVTATLATTVLASALSGAPARSVATGSAGAVLFAVLAAGAAMLLPILTVRAARSAMA